MQRIQPLYSRRSIASAFLAAGLLIPIGTAALCSAQETKSDSFQLLMKLDFGGDTNILNEIETAARDTNPEKRQAVEQKLIGILESKDATFLARQQACRMLVLAGSPKCVPVLGKMLTDDKLSHVARIPLEALRCIESQEALQKALDATTGNTRIGLINSLGVTGNPDAVKQLGKLAGDKDEATAKAALNALGHIGGIKAAKALNRIKAPDALKGKWCDACIACANSLAIEGKSPDAEEIFNKMTAKGNPDTIRAAGLLGLVRTKKDKAMPIILQALKSDDAALSQAACPAIIAMEGEGIGKTLSAELPGLPVSGKLAVLNALAGRKDTAGLASSINKMVNDQNAEVRVAAALSAAQLGDVSSVSVLASTFKNQDALSQAAAESLARLKGNDITTELINTASSGDVKVRAGVMAVIANRGERNALPMLYKAADDNDTNVRSVALKAIGSLSGRDDLSRLVELLLSRKDDGERNKLEQIIATAAANTGRPDEYSTPLIAGLDKADPSAKANLLGALSTIGGEKALNAVRPFVNSDVPNIKKAAVRAMAGWADDKPIDEVLAIAKNSADETLKILALRGYIRMIGLKKDCPDNNKLERYKQALEMATRPEEKQSILAGLTNVKLLNAMKLVETFLADNDLKNEALTAYGKIAAGITQENPAEARAALERVIKDAKENHVINSAKDALGKIKN